MVHEQFTIEIDTYNGGFEIRSISSGSTLNIFINIIHYSVSEHWAVRCEWNYQKPTYIDRINLSSSIMVNINGHFMKGECQKENERPTAYGWLVLIVGSLFVDVLSVALAAAYIWTETPVHQSQRCVHSLIRIHVKAPFRQRPSACASNVNVQLSERLSEYWPILHICFNVYFVFRCSMAKQLSTTTLAKM